MKKMNIPTLIKEKYSTLLKFRLFHGVIDMVEIFARAIT